ncbi:hypothetical protein AAC387_Pa05g1071 [Persea americana]
MGSLDLRFSIWVLFFCCLSLSRDIVEASHEVFLHLQSHGQPATVTQKHRTGYHFQPAKNWINGTFFPRILLFSCMTSYFPPPVVLLRSAK